MRLVGDGWGVMGFLICYVYVREEVRFMNQSSGGYFYGQNVQKNRRRRGFGFALEHVIFFSFLSWRWIRIVEYRSLFFYAKLLLICKRER